MVHYTIGIGQNPNFNTFFLHFSKEKHGHLLVAFLNRSVKTDGNSGFLSILVNISNISETLTVY